MNKDIVKLSATAGKFSIPAFLSAGFFKKDLLAAVTLQDKAWADRKKEREEAEKDDDQKPCQVHF